WEWSVPTRSPPTGRSRPASSAAAAREKLVMSTASGPFLSTARAICRLTFVVLPVPVPPLRRAEDAKFPRFFGPPLRDLLNLIWVHCGLLAFSIFPVQTRVRR